MLRLSQKLRRRARVGRARTGEMDITGDDNDGANDKSRRRDSFGALKNDLGQVLPQPRPKCDDPAVAGPVLASQRNHRGAVFSSHDRRAARDARVAVTATIASADWSEWFAEGKKTLGFVDLPPTKPRKKKYAQVRTPPKPKPAGEPATPRGSDTKKKHRD